MVLKGEFQNFDFSLLFSVEEEKRKTKILTGYLKKKNLEADPAEVMKLVGCLGNEKQETHSSFVLTPSFEYGKGVKES